MKYLNIEKGFTVDAWKFEKDQVRPAWVARRFHAVEGGTLRAVIGGLTASEGQWIVRGAHLCGGGFEICDEEKFQGDYMKA